MRIVFAGTPEFGIPCLEALFDSHYSLEAIYTQPDRPAGRGRKLQPSAVKEWALQHNIPVYQPLNFKTQSSIDELAQLKPDVLIVIAYGLILPRAVLEIPTYGCINVHASLLPRWRGASPIQHAILAGDKESGVTIMQMDVGMDTGNMLKKIYTSISDLDTAKSLHNKLSQLSPNALLQTLTDLENNNLQSDQQSESDVTYAGKINKEDARIDWQQQASQIHQQIRAFNPWPIAYFYKQDLTIRVHEAELSDEQCDAKPGTILRVDKSGLLVATAKQALLIKKIQFPGGKIIGIADWINSAKSLPQVGDVLHAEK